MKKKSWKKTAIILLLIAVPLFIVYLFWDNILSVPTKRYFVVVVDKDTGKRVENASLIMALGRGDFITGRTEYDEFQLPNGVFLGKVSGRNTKAYALADDYYSSRAFSNPLGKEISSSFWPFKKENKIEIEKIEIGNGKPIGNFYVSHTTTVSSGDFDITHLTKNERVILPVGKRYLYGENLIIGCHGNVNYGVDFSEPMPWNAVTSDMSAADIALDIDCSVPQPELSTQTILALGNAKIYYTKEVGSVLYDLPTIARAPDGEYLKSFTGNPHFANFVVKTKEGNYAKFIFLDGPFIKWAYQPDGSRNLDTSK